MSGLRMPWQCHQVSEWPTFCNCWKKGRQTPAVADVLAPAAGACRASLWGCRSLRPHLTTRSTLIWTSPHLSRQTQGQRLALDPSSGGGHWQWHHDSEPVTVPQVCAERTMLPVGFLAGQLAAAGSPTYTSLHLACHVVWHLLFLACCSIKAEPDSSVKPGSPISVSAKVRRNQAPVAVVTLLVRINYAPEQQLPMTASGSPGGSLAVQPSYSQPASRWPGWQLLCAGCERHRRHLDLAASKDALLPSRPLLVLSQRCCGCVVSCCLHRC